MSRFRQRIISNNNIRDDNYLNFTVLSEEPAIIQRGGENTETIYYTFDNPKLNNWIEFDNNSIITLYQYSIIYFKGNIGELENLDRTNNYMLFLLSGGNIEANGDLLSITYNRELTKSYLFNRLFAECKNLVKAPNLVSNILTEGCYYEMFSGCSSLIKAPELKASNIPNRAYFGMFSKCSSLKETPNLSATEISSLSYARMFEECTSLTKVSSLPALSIPSHAYSMMFRKCTSLENINILISATEVGEYGCEYMFSECYNLKNAPELKATSLQEYCYFNMFNNCTSLNISTDYILPAETLAPYCYANMFYGCYNLTNSPILPATTLAEGCYQEMFSECYKLKNAPKLESVTLVNNCYNKMFYDCANLNYIEALFETIPNNNCVENWMNGVYKNGTFIKSINAQWSTEIIPENWENRTQNGLNSYFSFVAIDDGVLFSFTNDGLSYSIDEGITWNILLKNEYTPTIDFNKRILWKGEFNSIDNNGIGKFSANKGFNVEGNIMSLLFGDNFENERSLVGKDYVFNGLFNQCEQVSNVSNLLLPATELSKYCYTNMFANTSIFATPDLPATKLTEGCYCGMFYNCMFLDTIKSLNGIELAPYCYKEMFANCLGILKVPNLLATTLAEGCYQSMFHNLLQLVNPPEIKATILAKNCCKSMFSKCSKLKQSPTLYAETLVEGCYEEMFLDCSNLQTIEALFKTIPSNEYTKNWVKSVNNAGVFIKNPELQDNIFGDFGIPENWSIKEKLIESKYLSFTSIEDSRFKFVGNDIKYSLDDGETWQILINNTLSPLVKKGEKILWKGTLLPNKIIEDKDISPIYPEKNVAGIGTFSSTGEFSVSGDILSIIYEENPHNRKDLEYNFIFYKLFYNCSKLKHSKYLILSPEILSIGCYYKMFAECSSLEDSPYNFASNSKEYSYAYMFYNCELLIDIPRVISNIKSSIWCCKGMFKGCTSLTYIPSLNPYSDSTGVYEEMFMDCTSLTTIYLEEEVHLTDSDYLSMFENCTSLKNVFNALGQRLKLKGMSSHCYCRMFKGCINLKVAPEILNDNVSYECYREMFENCINLETAPTVLLSTQLSTGCYYKMFKNCKNLKKSPQIKAKYFSENCFYEMFDGCTSLNNINVPYLEFSDFNTLNLYSKNWVNNVSNYGIFINNNLDSLSYNNNVVPSNWEIQESNSKKSLVFEIIEGGTITIKSSSNLLTKTISYSIDEGESWKQLVLSTDKLKIGNIVFNSGNKLLIIGDNNPCAFHDGLNVLYITFGGTAKVNIEGNIMALINNGTTIGNYAFYKLFHGYTNLISCENLMLPAEVSDYCYSNMFSNCIRLTKVMETLPSTELKTGCYKEMFSGCIELLKAPILPSTELKTGCYKEMFSGCTNLRYLNVSFISWNESCTEDWVLGVGTGNSAFYCYFYKNSLLSPYKIGPSYIPDNSWFIETNKNYPMYFKFKTTGHLKINFTGESSKEGEIVEWKIDDDISPKLWLEYSLDKGLNWVNVTKTVEETDSSDEIWIRGLGGNFNEEHNINGDPNYWKDYWISFIPDSECSVGGNILLASSIVKRLLDESGKTFLYYDLCLYTFVSSCEHMFDGATNIVDAHELLLVGDKIGKYACLSMFKGCTKLNKPPKLPITNLNYGCYAYMFEGCTSLVNAPELPATDLKFECYYGMFKDCTNLVKAPALPATTLGGECYSYMFQDCTSLETAPQLPATTLVYSCYSNMFQGCTNLTIAPELPAEYYSNLCYVEMFKGCFKLNYIKGLFKYPPDSPDKKITDDILHTFGWVDGVTTENGTFIIDYPSIDWDPNDYRGPNGIPNNWTIQIAN